MTALRDAVAATTAGHQLAVLRNNTESERTIDFANNRTWGLGTM
jgi:hypothetical protein